ncbi:SNF7 family protein [Pyrenophora tritici-repentis]|uniref:Snf7 n=1 Tax=Pyrenophora tritici-repentis TaxID=45151 RepID=A0A2W1D616_9PLEO|nr:SNF7 family protein [Pyrenophora tritici-repentis]KAF7579280.1 SNF7 family protein [Pyrenophora tritici-repentis]KAI0571289.1 SNF7 family protein [Pyrenophora tritici-repentis]KAI0573924.1 SNF7 family protein [Pyrenophora tritici-repentis]KAI0605862.1 SNF7 family protein [Pyrenophora tritici-repentis]
MLKRKSSFDHSSSRGPHVSIFSDDPTLGRHKRKRALFRPKSNKQTPQQWRPAPERSMSELLEFVLQHEDAFRNQQRLASLYADFRQQLDINPEGYHANIAAWTKALSDAARAGVVPKKGTTHDLLNIRAANELAQALQHPQYGQPVCLPAVFHEAVKKKEMLPMKDFLTSKESIYKSSWIPSPWQVLQWSLRQVGVIGQPQSPRKLEAGNFVIVKNVEVAADEILKKMKDHTSTADRVLSRTDFLNRFATTLNPSAPLTTDDLDVLLVFLARDKHAISYTAQTIKFKPEHEAEPLPVTQEDAAIANLRDTVANIHAQLPPLMKKISEASAAAREAVAAKQIVRAKAALRSKKLAEQALAQRSDVALQLEQVYNDLQHAADQVEIVEAMRAGAAALKGLNEKVGGAEGVQGVVDAVNEQMATTEEISNIINESGGQVLDEEEIDDEFEALERADREAREKEEAERTRKRLAELEAAEKKRRQRDAEQARKNEKEAEEARKKEAEAAAREDGAEEQVEEASQRMARMSFQQPLDEETEDAEEERVPVYA